ncbi:MAG: hypothetical protein ACLGQH_07930 [Acidobacteriota bacterium]
MRRNPFPLLAIVAFAGLLFVLSQLLPRTNLPVFERLRQGGRSAAPAEGGPEVRAKADVPSLRRAVAACRDQAHARMARPDWAGLAREDREIALAQVFVLCGADADYWAMSEAHQKRLARDFAAAFLDAPPGGAAKGLVDK